MVPRRFLLPYFVALLAVGVTACAPTPTPAPTPTASGFASEDEAFAAAEETLRAYATANNEVSLDDPSSFEDVYAWTAGDEYSNIREDLTTLASKGMTLVGETAYVNFNATGYDNARGEVSAVVCVDTSKADLLDSGGKSVLPPDRDVLVSSDVIFTTRSTPTGLAVASVKRNSENGACSD